MRRSDRLARLQELLARVQRNTAERRGGVASTSLAREPLVDELPALSRPAPVLRAHLEPIPPPPAVPADLRSDPDDWCSLLTRELSDPNPLEDAEETTFPSLVPPEPMVLAAAVVSEPSPARVSEDPIAPAPESQFEHAVRLAAEQRPEPPDPRALWLGAAEELRERRNTLPPEDDLETAPGPATGQPEQATTTPIPSHRRSVRPAAADSQPDATPTPIATFETARDSVIPAPMSRRRHALRPSPTPVVMGDLPAQRPTPYWAVVLLGCGVGLLFTLAYVAFRALDQPRGAAAQAVANTTLVARAAATTNATTEPLPTSMPPALPSVSAPTSGVAVSNEPPIPAILRPKDMGLLWVDAASPVTVYVQGLPAGESGAYLEVPCGLKNVRLARRDLPPPGHSFPMWLGRAESVLVPCGAANRVKMSSE